VDTQPNSCQRHPRSRQFGPGLLLLASIRRHAICHQRRVGSEVSIRGAAHVAHDDRGRSVPQESLETSQRDNQLGRLVGSAVEQGGQFAYELPVRVDRLPV
jgi:hypothetical protein